MYKSMYRRYAISRSRTKSTQQVFKKCNELRRKKYHTSKKLFTMYAPVVMANSFSTHCILALYKL